MFTKQTIQKQCIFVATLLFLYMAPAAAQGLVIGALDEVRQGPYSVTASQSRNLITTLFPGSTFTSSPTLTKAYLDTVQVVILASGKGSTTPIIPLSTAEQVALLNFVKAGGGAIILADNDTFGPSASDANDSLLSPFGLHVTGTLDGYQLVTITNTSSGEITNGRFGTVASFLTLYPGWFDNLGPHAIALGLLSANQQPALAVIHSGTLNPGSGCVVLLADGNIATNDALFGTISTPDAQTLIANAIACVGAVPGPPPLACPNGSTMDSDGDALLDCWEKNGIDSDGDGTPDFKLYDVNKDGIIQSSEQADPNHKDIYLEIDWMDQHKPDPTAIANVISSFANAPVTNPDGSKGIRLHIQTDEEAVAHNNEFAFAGCTGVAPAGTPEFDSVKSARFGTASERGVGVNALNAKRLAFHYSLFVHSLLGLGSVSGCAERPGNDFVVSLGGWWPLNPSSPPGTHGVGNVNEQSGTLMHEFGHNLGLRHGGGDNFNFKPNYLSVMSYARQISGWYVTRLLDYSFVALPSLDETNLNESTGIGFVPGAQTAFGVPPLQVIRVFANAAGPIDWNLNGLPATDTGVAININDFGYGDGGMGGVLMGYNDWANIWYDFRATMDFADGIHLSTPESMEVNIETAALNSPDSDGDGIVNVYDICPLTPNADQKDRNGNGVGDVCEGDLDHDGDVDKHDLKLFLAVRNTPASGPNDPMDLNGDGKITGLDAQKLVLNCTRPRCATHPRHR